MNFNIYLDDVLARALERLAKRQKVSRNALIRKAVEDLITKEKRAEAWSQEVLEWRGDPQVEPFESHRARLRPPAEDPFG